MRRKRPRCEDEGTELRRSARSFFRFRSCRLNEGLFRPTVDSFPRVSIIFRIQAVCGFPVQFLVVLRFRFLIHNTMSISSLRAILTRESYAS